MNLENTLKYHFAKSTMISDSPRSTASDSLTGTDIMAAMGMTQERAAMGYSAFLGKMGISSNDRKRAIELLVEYALNGATSTGGMGDASGPRLTDSAERDYFTLRERIVTVMKQVGYLQNYIKQQCMK